MDSPESPREPILNIPGGMTALLAVMVLIHGVRALLPLATDQTGILARLDEDRMLKRNDAGRWSVTNLGAVLFALEEIIGDMNAALIGSTVVASVTAVIVERWLQAPNDAVPVA